MLSQSEFGPSSARTMDDGSYRTRPRPPRRNGLIPFFSANLLAALRTTTRPAGRHPRPVLGYPATSRRSNLPTPGGRCSKHSSYSSPTASSGAGRRRSRPLRAEGLAAGGPEARPGRTRSLAEQHYAVHKGKPFYESLLGVPDRRPDAWRWCWRAARRWRSSASSIGPTDGAKAAARHDPRRLRPQRAEQPDPRQRQRGERGSRDQAVVPPGCELVQLLSRTDAAMGERGVMSDCSAARAAQLVLPAAEPGRRAVRRHGSGIRRGAGAGEKAAEAGNAPPPSRVPRRAPPRRLVVALDERPSSRCWRWRAWASTAGGNEIEVMRVSALVRRSAA